MFVEVYIDIEEDTQVLERSNHIHYWLYNSQQDQQKHEDDILWFSFWTELVLYSKFLYILIEIVTAKSLDIASTYIS